MTPRTIHIGGSFAIVLMAYWTYALLAVPWIEPPPSKPIAGGRGNEPPPPPPDELAILFPPNSWQRHAKIIRSNNGQSRLLWNDYQNHGDGWVELIPLTVVYMPDVTDGEAPSEDQIRHAVVMDAPAGANLHFDRPLDLNKGTPGRLIEGRLRGQVIIHSQGKQPDHQDDLYVETRDVDLSEAQITTAADVEFHRGLNWGKGRQMTIKLMPHLGPSNGNQEGPNIGGIEQFQVEHVERMHVEMAQPAGSRVASRPTAVSPLPGALSSSPAPLEITCRGPFRFNLIEQLATFRDQVDVERVHPDGPADHMGCELLSIYFTRPAPHAGAPAKHAAPGFDLQPARIVAQGTPTTLDAPTVRLQARAERLEYDLVNGQIYLEDSQEVTLHKDTNEIHAPNLRYTPGPPNHTGRFQLLAAGPGWLRGEMADHPGQQLEAHWQQKLVGQPQDDNEVISLLGGAMLKFQAMGRLEARDIHFWLRELPQDPAGRVGYQPDRLLAEGKVVGNSPQFACNVQCLETWFINPSIGPHGAAAAPTAATPAAPGQASVSPLSGQPAIPGGRQAHMAISGRLLQARVLLHDQQQGELTEATVVDNVRVEETQTAKPDDLPLLVTGQWLHATEAGSPQAKVTVTGAPAHMQGRGMSLTGPNIHIDRGANRLTMEGPGWMEKFLDRDLENRPLSQPGTMKIDWQKGMVFDGRKAHFQDSVKVTGETQLLRTGWLDVCFQRPISFSEAQPQQQPTVEKLICGDGVAIENRGMDHGQPDSYDRMYLQNFELNNLSGDFHGDGPGWLVRVQRGSGQGFMVPGGPMAGPGGAAVQPVGLGPRTQAPDPNQKTCIHLKFVKSLTGNKFRKTCEFHGQVRAAYAPVDSWTATLESDNPNVLGPQSFVLHCNDLAVDDMSPMSGSGSRNVELTGSGNVKAESTIYTARCYRLTYSQQKDMMILDGDGRSDAELFKQEGGEGTAESHVSAQQIQYFPRTNQAIVNGVHSLDMPQAPRAAGPGRR